MSKITKTVLQLLVKRDFYNQRLESKIQNLPIGRQLKQSVNVFHSLMLYLLLHSS